MAPEPAAPTIETDSCPRIQNYVCTQTSPQATSHDSHGENHMADKGKAMEAVGGEPEGAPEGSSASSPNHLAPMGQTHSGKLPPIDLPGQAMPALGKSSLSHSRAPAAVALSPPGETTLP